MSTSHPERELLGQQTDTPLSPLGSYSRIDFSIGPEASPAEAMERAGQMVDMTLPRFLSNTSNAEETCTAVQAVLAELVDVTARHKASYDLVGSLVFDGVFVTVSVGDMDCRLPPPEEEPGLYLVHRMAVEVGQYKGDLGGRVTWAAVAA
ncbi:hypothetical protein [Streptomyces collinus]|uniref:hypothetical protein n=1 Tax=Streptomyces collinus TaxID=42684 RepID=UPI003643803A